MHEHQGHCVRHHVRLPGGRQIEVVYLDSRAEHPSTHPPEALDADPLSGVERSISWRDDRSDDARGQDACEQDARGQRPGHGDTPAARATWSGEPPTSAPGEALHVCPRCAGGLVHPLDWLEEAPGKWRILLRCPDCGELREGVFGQALIERLDDELDRATAELLGDLRQITCANMAEEVERFSRALELDLIGPSDF